MTFDGNPFSGPHAVEVPLEKPPLVLVLAQVRFSDVLKINEESYIANFQDRLRKEYPEFKGEKTGTIVMGPSGPQGLEHNQVWRFSDEEEGWRVSLEHNFVALETKKYRSRHDFIDRLTRVVSAVSDCFDPTYSNRIGVRYVDRIDGSEFERVRELVRREMLGILGSDLGDSMHQAISHAVFTSSEGKLGARWGLMPANGTHDPTALPPIENRSWVLDIDSYDDFEGGRAPFDTDRLTATARGLASRAYTFFKWSVTDEFIRTYGGEV